MRFQKHVFICINERAAGDPVGCCKAKGSEQILETMKEEIKKQGLSAKIRINRAGCLAQCSKGVSIVVYPEGVWYGHVTLNDVNEIIEKHIVGNERVKRLQTA